jgi:hypothetical protein
MNSETTFLVELLGALLAFAFAARIGWLVLLSLRSGVARIVGGKEFSRSKKLFAYWTVIGLRSSLAVIFLAVGALRLAKL